MLNQYLRLLPDEALERTITQHMRPGNYRGGDDERGPCLVGTAERNTWHCCKVAQSLARLVGRRPVSIESCYDDLCRRALRNSGTYAGINDAIRRRAVALLSERHAEQLVAV